MEGVAGFEPAIRESKSRALDRTWRYPYYSFCGGLPKGLLAQG